MRRELTGGSRKNKKRESLGFPGKSREEYSLGVGESRGWREAKCSSSYPGSELDTDLCFILCLSLMEKMFSRQCYHTRESSRSPARLSPCQEAGIS